MRPVPPRLAASNTKVIVIILVCLGAAILIGVLACAGVGFWAVKKVTNELGDAQAVADTFFDQLKAGQLQPAFQSTTSAFQGRQTLAEFSAFVAGHPNLSGHTSRAMTEFNLNTVNGVNQMRLHYSLAGPTGATDCTLILLDDGGGWKIDRFTVP
jgi:hypothetical protein